MDAGRLSRNPSPPLRGAVESNPIERQAHTDDVRAFESAGPRSRSSRVDPGLQNVARSVAAQHSLNIQEADPTAAESGSSLDEGVLDDVSKLLVAQGATQFEVKSLPQPRARITRQVSGVKPDTIGLLKKQVESQFDQATLTQLTDLVGVRLDDMDTVQLKLLASLEGVSDSQVISDTVMAIKVQQVAKGDSESSAPLSVAHAEKYQKMESLFQTPGAVHSEIKTLESELGDKVKADMDLLTSKPPSKFFKQTSRVLKKVGLVEKTPADQVKSSDVYSKQREAIQSRVGELVSKLIQTLEAAGVEPETVAAVKDVFGSDKCIRSERKGDDAFDIDRAESLFKQLEAHPSQNKFSQAKFQMQEIMALKCLDTPIRRNERHVTGDNLTFGGKVMAAGVGFATIGSSEVVLKPFVAAFDVGAHGYKLKQREKAHHATQAFEKSGKTIFDAARATANHAEPVGVGHALRMVHNRQDVDHPDSLVRFLSDAFGESMPFVLLSADSDLIPYYLNPTIDTSIHGNYLSKHWWW